MKRDTPAVELDMMSHVHAMVLERHMIQLPYAAHRLAKRCLELGRWVMPQLLAHLVMSLCNHTLSVVCRCHCRRLRLRHRLCHPRRRRLCTALPVTGLIIEASYLTNICSYAPSICT